MISLLKLSDKNSPVYACGFRPFFLVAAIYTVLLSLHYFISGYVVYHDGFNGFNLVWYQYEFLFGSGLAALSGFLLTAFPAWTNTEKVQFGRLFTLIVVWGIARIFSWFYIYCGILPSVFFGIAYLVMLLASLTPSVLDKKHCRHRIFYYQLWLLLGAQSLMGLFWDIQHPEVILSWLKVCLGLVLVMYMTVFSRMSNVVVNLALDKYGIIDERHFAKPPRRNFAIGVIALYLLSDFVLPSSTVSGWFSLASAAAILNILNDWHMKKAWRDFYYQALYSVYLFVAVGFCLIGTSNIWGIPDAGLSLFSVMKGALSLSILMVLLVVGQRHTGRRLANSWLIRLAILLMFGLEILHIAQAYELLPSSMTLIGNNMFVLFSFLLYLFMATHMLTQPRVDGQPD